MSRRPTHASSVLLLAVALSACGGASGGASTATPSNPERASSVAAAAPVRSRPRPVTTLIDPGAEPRVALRYRFVAGQVDEWTMDYQSGTATGVTQDPQPTQPPMRMRMPFRVTTENVRPDGTGVFFGQFGRAVAILPDGTAPEVQQAVDAAMAGMDRVTIRFVMDARGETLEESTQVPSDIAPEMAASLRSSAKTVSGVASLFPNEPVGVGARWSVKQRVQSELVQIDQTFTNTLQAIDGNVLRLACEVAQGAPVQRVESAALPPGTVMWLEALEGRGRGTSVIGLDGSTKEASLDLVARMRFRVESDGQTQAVFGLTTANLRIE